MDTQGIESALNQLRSGGLPRTQNTSPDQDPLREVAQEFEALFVQQMFDAMRETVDRENSLFHGGEAEETFQDMLYEQYSHITADAGGTGLADMIYEQISDGRGDAENGAEKVREVMDSQSRIRAYENSGRSMQ